jgi:hypothetical protein
MYLGCLYKHYAQKATEQRRYQCKLDFQGVPMGLNKMVNSWVPFFDSQRANKFLFLLLLL